MAFTIRRLDHVVVNVTDLDRALAFYCGVLGCTEERRPMDTLVQLRAGTSMIDLMRKDKAPGGGAPNMDHFAVVIDPFDEAAIRRHLESRGVAPGEVFTRYGAEGNGPSMYIHDPDGNMVELKGPPER
jgi:catechol 2,3-dioxygenase-like lactoylglutathione lyase family enzyme